MAHEDFLKQAAEAKTRIKQVTAAEVEQIVEQSDPLILDVREESEYQAGHLSGATNVSLNRLEAQIDEVTPDRSTQIVCYCGGGNRSALAADALAKLGYTNVVSLEGGLSAWQNSGKKVTRSESVTQSGR